MQNSSKISNIQYELLKLYSNNVTDSELLEIKGMLANYFANKLDDSFEKFYQSNNLTSIDLESWSQEHNRIGF